MKTTKPMLEYLATCSKTSLQSFQLARLNDRSNLRQRIIELMDELVEVDIQARIAEWVLVHRRRRTSLRRRSARNSSTELNDLSLPLLPRNEYAHDDAPDLPALGPNPVMHALRDAAAETSVPGPLRSAPITEAPRRIA